MEKEKRQTRFRNIWIVIIAILVTVIGISNAMLMSVTERIREIGTMKCLGALSAFIRVLFLIESGILGVAGGIVGAFLGAFFSIAAYGVTYGIPLAWISLHSGITGILVYGITALAIGIALSMVAAIYPAGVASRMVPADALRTTV